MRKRFFILSVFFVFSLCAEEIIENGDSELEKANNDSSESLIENKELTLKKWQKVFFDKKRKGNENTLFIHYKKGVSYSIRTRETMATSIVLENDKIDQIINGDSKGFEVAQIGENILAIKPTIIGVDTNITIIGKSKEIYNLYVFSTNIENRKNPTLLAYIFNPRLKDKSYISDRENYTLIEKYRLPKGKKLDDYLIIGDNSNRLLIERSKISQIKYKQTAKARIRSKSGLIYIEDDESKALKAIEIFSDNEFTYFKFNRDLASSRFPAVFQVINKTLAIVNVSVVGDFLVAKTLSKKWIFREGKNEVYIEAIE